MTEKITINVPHKHSRAEARKRVDEGFGKVQEQVMGKGVTVDQTWSGDRMDFSAGMMGQKLTGNLVVEDTSLRIEVDLPWILAKLSGTVREKLEKSTQLLLEKK